MLGSATGKTYEDAIPHVLADNRVDALIVNFVPTVTAGADEVAAAIERAVERSNMKEKPVLTVMISEGGMPRERLEDPRRVSAFAEPDAAARALGLAAARAEWLRRPAGVIPPIAGIAREHAESVISRAHSTSPDIWLTPEDARSVLEAYGIPLVPERVVGSLEEAVAAAPDLGFPVAVKTAVPGVHKTETGGVALGLSDRRSCARMRMRASTATHPPGDGEGGTAVEA